LTTKEKLKGFRATLLGIDPFVMKLRYKLFHKPKKGSIEEFIDQHAKKIPNLKFMQIGGNDGFVKDPIFRFVKKYGWKGIVVEPQKDVFHKRLKRTYRLEKNVILENVAIAAQSGTKILYKLAISNSRWATGLATFDRKTLEYQIDRNYVDDRAKREGIKLPANKKDYIVEEAVPCETIDGLMKKHHFASLDLLQIDTEGFDFEIIKTIDFSKVKPAIISFESEHLSGADREACVALLKSKGYVVTDIGRDSVAVVQV
jgi:FkbM family methyltransferase